ncbi:hypothetical protein J8273_1020 [Carpediemonas membranifera]|uniref:Transmembrane protein n=1 Tax=Carpediemonas membranifera TaxID=201153 RepID=A0A8J6BC17_9EUKA|nr:hypothetical protein J8273_1020 [Carpediemonas membranifera]|eukprot:KAG9397112.1 hypothetical protein J8273_1020 [Carpediemonas membranifera]
MMEADSSPSVDNNVSTFSVSPASVRSSPVAHYAKEERKPAIPPRLLYVILLGAFLFAVPLTISFVFASDIFEDLDREEAKFQHQHVTEAFDLEQDLRAHITEALAMSASTELVSYVRGELAEFQTPESLRRILKLIYSSVEDMRAADTPSSMTQGESRLPPVDLERDPEGVHRTRDYEPVDVPEDEVFTEAEGSLLDDMTDGPDWDEGDHGRQGHIDEGVGQGSRERGQDMDEEREEARDETRDQDRDMDRERVPEPEEEHEEEREEERWHEHEDEDEHEHDHDCEEEHEKDHDQDDLEPEESPETPAAEEPEEYQPWAEALNSVL